VPAPLELLPALLGAGVVAGFATRGGGSSQAPYDSLNLAFTVGDEPAAVRANRAALLTAAAPAAQMMVWAEQVHGGDVAVVTEGRGPDNQPGEQAVPGVDALVTTTPGLLLCIRVADCLPVLFADAHAGVIGAAHAGRRGLVAGILHGTVAAMESLGAERGRIRAVIGPGICGRCYEVPATLAAEVGGVLPGSRAVTTWGTPSLDLPAAAYRVVQGLALGAVELVDECTAEQPDRWFSYRRAQRTGRFAGFVALT